MCHWAPAPNAWRRCMPSAVPRTPRFSYPPSATSCVRSRGFPESPPRPRRAQTVTPSSVLVPQLWSLQWLPSPVVAVFLVVRSRARRVFTGMICVPLDRLCDPLTKWRRRHPSVQHAPHAGHINDLAQGTVRPRSIVPEAALPPCFLPDHLRQITDGDPLSAAQVEDLDTVV